MSYTITVECDEICAAGRVGTFAAHYVLTRPFEKGASFDRNVSIVDTVPPVVTLVVQEQISLTLGEVDQVTSDNVTYHDHTRPKGDTACEVNGTQVDLP